MVDEKKLIDRLQNCVNYSDNANFTNGLLSAIDIVNQQPKIGEWIPCSTGKMPHPGSAVLIQLRRSINEITGDNERTFDISFLRTSKNEWASSCGTYPFEDVVAWKPIKAYKKE